VSAQTRIRRALISVTDKSGIADFARRLSALGVELVSTGGTAKLLRESGLTVRDVSDLTGFPEMFDGRVKTLHPMVHGGILHVRDDSAHMASVREHKIPAIDMVVVNLYAFEKAAAKSGVTLEELIESIDIGGPALVRSSAKNYQDVAIVTSPGDYGTIAASMEANGATLPPDTRWRLAQKAFAMTAAYDAAIANVLEQVPKPVCGTLEIDRPDAALPYTLRLTYQKQMDLRYGENPHQRAALFVDPALHSGVAHGKQLQGKELSYNNIVDLQAAWDLVQEFTEPMCAIIKHTNPCGAATGADLCQAYLRALEADPVSAFGGVIGVNQQMDEKTAIEMSKLFVEAIAAPGFDGGARAVFAGKKNLRLVEVQTAPYVLALKQVSGGMLAQDADVHKLDPAELKIVTKRKPTETEMQAMLFAWKICKHVKSNAIVYARAGQTIGIGAGQMSRVDSCKLGAMKATLPLKDSVAASDAFFPFPDGVEEIARAGATAIISPGGSVRDQEIIAAADRLGLAMVFTGVRHFRH